jgi:Uma2 family endonuclease
MIQSPFELSNRSEPEPDVMVLRPRDDHYAEHHPYPSDVYLLIEVSDSTVVWDRTVKLPLYSRESVPEVWIADLTADVIEVYRQPSRGGYTDVRHASRGESISPIALPNLTLAVSDILG